MSEEPDAEKRHMRIVVILFGIAIVCALIAFVGLIGFAP